MMTQTNTPQSTDEPQENARILHWSLQEGGNAPLKNIKLSSGNAITYMAMDAGSTSERTVIYADDLEYISEPLVVDSGILNCTRDYSSTKSPSRDIKDNLEIIIKTENKESIIGEQVHILKGNLRKAADDTSSPLAANASKTEQSATYVNILANVAIALLYNMNRTGLGAKNNLVAFTVALPSEDMEDVTRQKDFLQRLEGTYDVEFPRLQMKFTFTLPRDDMMVASELEAVMYYWFAKTARDPEETIFFIAGGGRNISFGGVKNGLILHDKMYSMPGGGEAMNNILAKQLQTGLKINKPDIDRAAIALTSGKFRVGSESVDIGEYVRLTKQEFADVVYTGLMRAIDIAGLQATEISCIVCDGRIFNTTPLSEASGGDFSILEALQARFASHSENTNFKHISPDSFVIPEGLILVRVAEEAAEADA